MFLFIDVYWRKDDSDLRHCNQLLSTAIALLCRVMKQKVRKIIMNVMAFMYQYFNLFMTHGVHYGIRPCGILMNQVRVDFCMYKFW